MAIINATIFVQAFHFSIAYLIVKYVLFKPALKEINDENALQKSLIKTIQNHQEAITKKEQQLQVHWQKSLSYFSHHMPALKEEYTVLHEKIPHLILPRYNKLDLEESVQTVSKELKKKVSHVR